MTQHAELNQTQTWREIHAQPSIWRSWGDTGDFASYRAWVNEQNPPEIWFCGAGTSAFIGDILVAGLEDQRGTPPLRAVASTDLVAQPEKYLKDRAPLVVNFGRSGNSSESIGTLEAIAALAPQSAILNITCNRQSALGQYQSPGPSRTLILPPATHDQGFAMTSSFSTMLLSALSIMQDPAPDVGPWQRASDELDRLLPVYAQHVAAMPSRVVFLGTGALCYAAREAALKVMELTAGKVATMWDSILGFRHGPKSFIQEDTQIVIFTGGDTSSRHYEADLIAELRMQYPNASTLVIGRAGDIKVAQSDGEAWCAPLMVAYAQIAGAMWSAQLGLNIDDPFAAQGTLTRVVSGVTLYEVAPC